jgi:hypothetical protein
MAGKKTIHSIAIFVEFIAGSGLAIFFHMVLKNESAAYIIFGIGVLLSLVTYLIREEIEKTTNSLLEQYRQVHEIPFALSHISNPACQAKAQELLAGTKRTITMLQQGYIPLDESEFYLEGAKLSDQSSRHIMAVDPLTPGWGTRGALLNFYVANLRAMDRGAQITRIFVVNRDEMTDPEVQRVLLTQYRDNIDVRITYRDELPSPGEFSGRDTNCPCDFAIYDGRSITEVFPQSGKFFGRKTDETAEVAKYQHLYDLIEHNAHIVTEEAGQIILAADALALAS